MFINVNFSSIFLQRSTKTKLKAEILKQAVPKIDQKKVNFVSMIATHCAVLYCSRCHQKADFNADVQICFYRYTGGAAGGGAVGSFRKSAYAPNCVMTT